MSSKRDEKEEFDGLRARSEQALGDLAQALVDSPMLENALAAAFGAYFMSSYGVVIDTTMMVNVLQTDLRETRDLLSLPMALTVLALGVLPAA